VEAIKSFGVDFGVDYKAEDFSKKILEATEGKGVDLIVDFVGASYFKGREYTI
jgi:NADPH:quinone reductase-like Zn-dependent oxidoreductase